MKNTVSLTFIFFIIPFLSFSQTEINIRSSENNIHITKYGSGDPILIINGGPGLNSKGFASLAEVIGKNNTAILYDQRGTGKSTISQIDSSTITIDLMVEDIEVIRKHLKIKEWVVLGHSFGGMLASYYTTKYPEHVRGLILSSSGGIDMELLSRVRITSKLSEKELHSFQHWSNKIQEGDTTYNARLNRANALASAYLYNKSFIPAVAHRLLQANLTINRLVFQSMIAIDFNCAEGLKKFNKPTLIMQGKQDVVDIELSNKAHNVLPNSKVIIIDKCGHYGWLEQSETYFGEINKFLITLEKV